jgi:hypothetical protein
MLLKVSDIPPYEAFRLCCSDRRLQAELKGQLPSSRSSQRNPALVKKVEPTTRSLKS